MANPIKIKWLSDDADAVRGNKAVKDSLKDVADGADDVGDDITKAFRDAAREAGWSGEKIEDALDEVARTADDTADDVVRSQRRMGERSQEVGQEIRQNLGEGIANAARGDFEALSDTIGDTLGGAVAGIGGIGFAAAGAAGALGLGAIVAVFQSINAEAEATEERVQQMYDRLAESGAAYLSRANIAEAIGELSQEDVLKGIERATQLQVDQSLVLNAMVGDSQALAVIYAELAERKAQEVQAIRDSGASLEDQAVKIDAANTKYAEQTEFLRQIQTETEIASSRWTAVSDAIKLANGDVSVLDKSLRNLPNPTVRVKVEADDSEAYRALARFQQAASRGVRVPVGLGRTLE